MTVQNAPFETSAPQPATPLHLWSPGTIAAITIVAGYPVGVLFATGNWYRLGLRQKAHWHLLASAWLSVGLGSLGYYNTLKSHANDRFSHCPSVRLLYGLSR